MQKNLLGMTETQDPTLLRFRKIWHWMHDSLLVAGAPPPTPDYFVEDMKPIIKSKVKVWRAVNKLIKANGKPVKPVHILKCAIQVKYNKLKNGIDISTMTLWETKSTTIEVSEEHAELIKVGILERQFYI